MRRAIFILLLLFTSLVASLLKAQQVIDSIDVEKERTFIFPPAIRDFDKIDLLKRTKPQTEQTYKFKIPEYKLPTISPSIKAYTLILPAFQPLKANYIKLGVGNYWTSQLEAYLTSLRHKKINYGVKFRHLSSLWGTVDKRNSAASTNELTINGKYMTHIGEMNAHVGYARRSVRFYGYDTLFIPTDSDSIRQTFHDIHGSWGLTFYHPTHPLDFSLQTTFYHFTHRFGAKDWSGNIHFTSKYQRSSETSILIPLELLFNTYAHDFSIHRHIFRFSPTYVLKKDWGEVESGISLVYTTDTTSQTSPLNAYPILKGRYHVIQNILMLYGHLTGEMQQKTLKLFSQENPFLAPQLPLAHTNELLRLEIGANVAPIEQFGINVKAGYRRTKNLPLFLNSAENLAHFLIVYATASSVFSGVDMYFQIPKVKAIFSGFYQHFQLKNQEKAWHIPALTHQLNVTFTASEHISVVFNALHLAKFYAKNTLGNSFLLRPIWDIQLKGEYAISEKLRAFLQLNNLTNQRYERYWRYPQQRLLILVGGNYQF